MKKLLVTIMLIGVLFVSGCSSVQTTAIFREQEICVGQSNDSIEKSLGQPNLVAHYRYNWFWGHIWEPQSQAWNVDDGAHTLIAPRDYSNYVEWTYIDSDQSLILWLRNNSVYGIWLKETSCLKVK